MILEIMLTLSTTCNPVIKNTSGYSLNEFDRQTLQRAYKTCKRVYDSSCVKLFWKYDKIDYRVVCGEGE